MHSSLSRARHRLRSFLRYRVPDWEQRSSSVCFAASVESDGGTFVHRRRVLGPTLAGGTTQHVTRCSSTLAYDMVTESTPTSIAETRELRLSEALLYDGQPMILCSRQCTTQRYPNVWPKGQLFSMEFAKKTKFRQTSHFCGGSWNTYDADLARGASACQHHRHAAGGH